MNFSQYNAVLLCLLLAAFGLAISTIELLISNAFASDKLLSTVFYKNNFYKIVSRLYISEENRFIFVKSLLIIRLSVIIILIIAVLFSFTLIPYCLFVVVVANLLLSINKQIGNDGADQMNNIIFVSLLFYFILPNKIIHHTCIYFIVGQSLLSYFTAGFVKVTSSVWMKSNAVGNILGSLSYGQPTAFRLLNKYQFVGLWLSRLVACFELLLPFSILLPPEYCLYILTVAALFHINCGIWMGLNDFIWAFIATYPLIFWACLHM